MAAPSPSHASPAPPSPRVPDAVRTTTDTVFSVLARLRKARPFHPRGASFTATLTVKPDGPLGWLRPTSQPALVRLSNAAGMPAHLPDVYGLALRVTDGSGANRPLDLLLASSSQYRGLRHLLAPARGFDTARYSSLLLYRHQGHLELLGARYSGPSPPRRLRLADLEQAARDGLLTFRLAITSPRGRWRDAAEVHVHDRLPAAESSLLRFHPWNVPAHFVPAGPINHLRAAAYEAAQRSATSE